MTVTSEMVLGALCHPGLTLQVLNPRYELPWCRWPQLTQTDLHSLSLLGLFINSRETGAFSVPKRVSIQTIVGWSESYSWFHQPYCFFCPLTGESLADYLCLSFSHVNLVLCVSLSAVFKFSRVPGPVERGLEEFTCTLRISSFWVQF